MSRVARRFPFRRPDPPPALAGPDLDPDYQQRVLPIRAVDLSRRLIHDPALAPSEQLELRQFCKLLGSTVHHEFHQWQIQLKDLYAPLDPDADHRIDLRQGTRERTEDLDEAFLGPLQTTLTRANYQKLDLARIQDAIEAPNELGLNYQPDFDQFEHLLIYVRGQTQVVRHARSLRTWFRKHQVVHPGYSRMVVALKFRPNPKLGPFVRSDVLYLRLFKDVPHVDMEMHLPEQGTRVVMRRIDKAQIASPLMVGVPTFLFKLLTAGLVSPLAMGMLMVAPISAGVNSFFGFQRAKQKHLHHMIRSLYYLTLANNASVIHSIIDAAEEEEYKEALLAYFLLWRHRHESPPWDAARLEAVIQEFLLAEVEHPVAFQIGNAVNQLVRRGLVQADSQGRLHPAELATAIHRLDEAWDNIYRPASTHATRS